MSQITKRDADTAFEGNHSGNSHSQKRLRRKRTEKREGTNFPLPKATPIPAEVKTNTPNFSPKSVLNNNDVIRPEPRTSSDGKLNEQTPAESPGKGRTPQQKKGQPSRKLKGLNAASNSRGNGKLNDRTTGSVKQKGKVIPLKSEQSHIPPPKKSHSNSEPLVNEVASERRAVKLSKRPRKRNATSLKTRGDKDPAPFEGQKADQLVGEENPKQLVKAKQRMQLAKNNKQKFKAVEQSKTQHSKQSGNQWRLSSRKGGMFIDQDPLLTADDQFLILATPSEIQVYSTKTSLLVRSFRVDLRSHITSCSLSKADPKKLYVSSSKGLVSLWDWTTAAAIGKYDTGTGLQQVLPLRQQEENETILLLQDDPQGYKRLVACSVNTFQGTFTESHTLLQRTGLSPCFRSYAQGTVLMACAEDHLLIGQSRVTEEGQLDLTYTWREITVLGFITSFDAHVSSGKSKTPRKVPFLDVVIGLNDGVIMHYQDILFKLIGKEKKNKTWTEDIVGHKLHWHRTAVNTVKWSRDRNYIISGGNETVLVIWQLDSNQHQFLPHLSAPILNLTVSNTGSAYALRLGDNSVMILSTADLLPSTNVCGLALGVPPQNSSLILLHPKVPNRLLAAVPSDAAVTGPFHGRRSTLLQIYDVDSNVQLSRQALTRNMITTSNVAPTGQPVKEPTVTHIAISHDGKWLATVDEWHSPDLESFYSRSDCADLRGRCTETSLRLWLWNDEEGNFEQVTRIDEPHKAGPNSVLSVSFNPAKLELATTGSDANIRIWSPKQRHRNGVPVRNKANEQLYTWSSSRTVQCSDDAALERGDIEAKAMSASLAYSDDGSILAVAWFWLENSFRLLSESPTATFQWPRTRFVHFIDPTTGRIVLSNPSLLPSASSPAKLLFHSRYLICLSQTLTILDTITDRLVASPIELNPEYVVPNSWSPSYIARNKFDGTVAMSISRSEKPRGTQLVVLSFSNDDSPRDALAGGGVDPGVQVKVVDQTSITGTVKGLLALTTGSGYLVIDERNQCRFLRPKVVTRARTIGGAEGTEQVTRSLDSIFGRQALLASATTAVRDERAYRAVDDTVNGQTGPGGGLDAVLRFVSTAQAPPPAELFQKVIGVMARGLE
ncbi:uncharacterized protein A1O5_12107 [Cladophialophora psammophila CBS 110553]|uniref:Uncharacterized protein n=1 Tax=Cladophialophora psammophila CBS 110553 TaxID=1182543 RepID=W9VUT3_9EURO|nr:uncharacterized protein A1O5_12107 [Cladophialophora psammophila CBS 110553]EXJ59482.1 hypothetical protein A1O5_12107 [Cladophialophora psammophila CBS 110553]